jgi:hypothetical protein
VLPAELSMAPPPSPTRCSVLVFLPVARTLARVTAAAPSSTAPTLSSVLSLGVTDVPDPTTLVSMPALVLSALSLTPTLKYLVGSAEMFLGYSLA